MLNLTEKQFIHAIMSDLRCASIASTVPGMSRGGFHGIEVSDKADLIASDGSGPLSGVYSIITSNKALIARYNEIHCWSQNS